jgi:predicted transcriptional regulator
MSPAGLTERNPVLPEVVPAVGRKPLKERRRRPEEALPHAVNHWVRVETLAVLQEGPFSVAEVARLIGEDVRVVRNHVKDLYDSGCIEFAGYKHVSGTLRPTYSCLVLPVVGVEAYRAMSLDERHDLNGAVIQGIQVESVSSFRNGRMDEDENLCLVWQPLNLDIQGKRELSTHLTVGWEATKGIETRSLDRMAESGEQGCSTIAAFLGFERGRRGRPKGGYHRRDHDHPATGDLPAVGRKPLEERSRRPDEALTYAVNHWVRVETLAVLQEGPFSVAEVARLIGEDVRVVRNHVKDLYDSGCIEFAGYKRVSGFLRPTYCGFVLPVVGVDSYRAMPLDDRHDLNGAVVQGLHVEALSSFRNGRMDDDENLCLVWQPLNLDGQGKRELLAHLTATWEGTKGVETRSLDRMAESGEEGSHSIAAFLGFERGRRGRPKGGYHRPGSPSPE